MRHLWVFFFLGLLITTVLVEARSQALRGCFAGLCWKTNVWRNAGEKPRETWCFVDLPSTSPSTFSLHNCLLDSDCPEHLSCHSFLTFPHVAPVAQRVWTNAQRWANGTSSFEARINLFKTWADLFRTWADRWMSSLVVVTIFSIMLWICMIGARVVCPAYSLLCYAFTFALRLTAAVVGFLIFLLIGAEGARRIAVHQQTGNFL